MSLGDPLDGLPRPTGSADALAGIARSWTGGSQVLGHTSQSMEQMTGRVLAQAWSGPAAMACASSCVNDAALVAMTADAYEIAGGALQKYSGALSAAQAQWDRARRLADEAVSDETTQNSAAHQQKMMLQGAPLLIGATYVSPLRSQARQLAQDAITDVKTAGATAASAMQSTLKPFLPPPPKPKPKPASHWYSPVTSFVGGAWDGVKDPVVMIGGLVGLHGSITKNWSDLGHGLAYGVTHPAKLGEGLIDWQDLSSGNYSRWAGNLLPTVAATVLSGGAAAGVKGADTVGLAGKTGEELNDLSDADKVAALTKGEDLVPGSVGQDAITGEHLTADGRLDYSYKFDEELKNFTHIDQAGTTTLDTDKWLVNVHNGKIPLSGGRSLKYTTSVDDVLANSRGGFLNKLALIPDWGKRTDVSVLHIPAGTEVDMTIGGTERQLGHLRIGEHTFSHVPVGYKDGGGLQVYLKSVSKDWVVWTGKAPWPSTSTILTHAAAGGATIRVPDALADVSQGN
jgi:hypothetical protein